ncbi:hypothetical protein ACKA04_08000 [Helcococcus kunzii]|uniref:hypothetical protein n=1 Tax=Helcococcus kunzii TaxID=40091 RepID=UPI0038A88ACC
MGIFLTSSDELYSFVKDEFGETDNYLIAMKYNSFAKSLLKATISTIYRNMDSSRNVILYFDEKGIHEKEMSFSDKSPFVLIPWNEIEEFTEDEKWNKVILKVNHLGKVYGYEIPFNGRIMKGNKERYNILHENSYHRLD